MDDQHPPQPPDDEISYEDFDDVPPPPADDLDVLDLDTLDAPPTPPVSVLPPKRAKPTPSAEQPADEAEAAPPPAEAAEPVSAPPAEKAPETPAPEPPRPSVAPAKRSEEAPAAPEKAAETEQPAEPPPPPPPDWIYYALIGLPPEVGARVLELRAVSGINDMPPPGIMLMSSFRTQALAAVQEELARWARNHLPLQMEATGVQAEVRGRQQYVAAWTLQPAKELLKAVEELRRALLLLVKPLSDEKPRPHLVIGAQVAAARYPQLIAQMQRDFEPFVWHAAQVVLVRKDAQADAGAWEIVASYD